MIGDEEGMFEGYASTFGNVDRQNDIVMPGAFMDSLRMRMPKVLLQHNMDKPIGKCMEVREDNKGLYVKAKLVTSTTDGKDAYELVKAGVIDSMSIGYVVEQADFDQQTGVRKIEKMDLYEFSLVTMPANEEAMITTVKSLPTTEREFEKFLVSNGFGREASKCIVAHGMKGYQRILREAGEPDAEPPIAPREADKEKAALQDLIKTLRS